MTPTTSLSSVCDRIFTGLPPRLKDPAYGSGQRSLPVVGIRAITAEGHLDSERLEEFALAGGLPDSIRPLVPGDVLMTIRGSTPKTAVVEQPFAAKTFPSGNLAVLRPDSSRLEASYLWSFLSNIFRDDHHPLLTRATTQQLSIRISALSKLRIPVPALEEQKAIGTAALALRNAVIAQQKAATQGERTFQAFLSDTFSRL